MTRADSTETNTPQDRVPWTRPGFLLAGGFVILIVILLVVVLMLAGGTQQSGQPAQPPPAGSPPAPPGQPGLGPTTVPDAPPGDVTWQLFQTVALPVSASAGPHRIAGSTAAGYSHTPTGALMACAQISIRKLLAPDWRAVVNEQVEPGPGRDAFAQQRAKVLDVTPAPGELGQIAAFKFVNYDDQIATIKLVTRFTSAAMQAETITLRWEGGDWKEVLQPDGADSPTADPVTNLIGYVPWGGV